MLSSMSESIISGADSNSLDKGLNNDLEGQVVKPTGQRGKAKKPKRNKSAFILFSIEKRALLKSDIKDQLNSNEMMVKLAELWKDLPKVERERYYTEARDDKMRYLKELDTFSKAYPSEIIHNKTKKNHVKKPCSAYAIFLKENKAVIKKHNSELKMADVLKIVSEKWKKIGDREKIMYQEKARVEKELTRTRIGEKNVKLNPKNTPAKPSQNEHKTVKSQESWHRTDFSTFENFLMPFKLESALDAKLEESPVSLRLKLEGNNPAGQTLISDVTASTAHSEGLLKSDYSIIEGSSDTYNSHAHNFRYPPPNQIVLNGVPIRESDLEDEGGKQLMILRTQTIKKANEVFFELLNFNLPPDNSDAMKYSNIPFSRNNMNFFVPTFSLPNDGFNNSNLKNGVSLASRQETINNAIVNSLKVEPHMDGVKEEADTLMKIENSVSLTSK